MSSAEEAQAVVEKFDSQVIFYLHHLIYIYVFKQLGLLLAKLKQAWGLHFV